MFLVSYHYRFFFFGLGIFYFVSFRIYMLKRFYAGGERAPFPTGARFLGEPDLGARMRGSEVDSPPRYEVPATKAQIVTHGYFYTDKGQA